MTISWPATELSVLLWAETILAWVLCEYVLLGNQPIVEEMGSKTRAGLPKNWERRAAGRAAAMLLSLFLVHSWTGWRSLILMLVLPVLAVSLPFLRVALATRNKALGAELELTTNAVVVAVSGLLIGNPEAVPLRRLVQLPVSPNHLATVLLIAAILAFLATGSTHLVRGVLARVDAMPLKGSEARDPATEQLDIKEYNRGRVIGVIERIIMTVVVAVGAYAALMFLIGAKGLIRSNELTKHEFAEYFLIGTLASAAIAIVFGLMISGIVRVLW